MPDQYDEEHDDTLEVKGETKSSARVLAAIKKAERAFSSWQGECDEIDAIYAREDTSSVIWSDPEFDLFWASTEILKPAIYAHPPVPVVSPQFKDRRPLMNVTAEMLERTAISAFDRTDLDEGMTSVRDDLIFYNRGQLWVTYESDDGQRVCVEHLDRKDFLHPPARKWSEVPWVARRAWMTRAEMRKRFRKHSGDAYKDATLCQPSRGNEYDSSADQTRKAGVWEVWHKADKRVYWVTDGVNVMLDEGDPHLKLRGFFPCPRPAYGTLRARTLEPVPDYRRYAGHFSKINKLTSRIYALLDQIRMKGLIPAGGDVGEVIEQLMAEDRSDMLLIPVPGAALTTGSGQFVQWLPLAEFAEAIQGLIEARGQLVQNFYELSGISDIMRGATDADETLGAQRLKSQYGSVRVREKVEELQRIAADVTRIAAEIMAENFSKETLLDMSQMEIPTKAEIKAQVKSLESDARDELKELMDAAKEAEQPDPEQFHQAQQQIVAKYAQQIKAVSETVPLEDVMDLLRDDRARGFAFEIATDSTIMTDEMAEKQARNEFMGVFTQATQGLMGLASMGEAGAKLSGELLKFVLQPYRVGRELNGVIDDFIDAAPQMAAQAKEGGDDQQAMMQLAQAELAKAQAQGQNYQAQAQLKQQELELKAAEAQEKARQDEQKFALTVQETEGKIAETSARIEKIYAEIQLAQERLGLDAHREDREDVKLAADISSMQADAYRADRQQGFNEMSSDRQMAMAERQSAQEIPV